MGGLFGSMGKGLKGLFGNELLMNNLSAANAYLDGDYDRAGAIGARSRQIRERLEQAGNETRERRLAPAANNANMAVKKWIAPQKSRQRPVRGWLCPAGGCRRSDTEWRRL